MKTLLLTLGTLALLGAFPSSTSAALEFIKSVKGDALCAKCELKETEKCQTAIRVQDGDKKVIYYATDNQVAQDFHAKVCKATMKVIATGTVRERNGRWQITLMEIQPDKS